MATATNRGLWGRGTVVGRNRARAERRAKDDEVFAAALDGIGSCSFARPGRVMRRGARSDPIASEGANLED